MIKYYKYNYATMKFERKYKWHPMEHVVRICLVVGFLLFVTHPWWIE
jgi:hypothetical protein